MRLLEKDALVVDAEHKFIASMRLDLAQVLEGGLRKRSRGGNENPTRNRKSGLGNPPPAAGASELYPNHVPTSFELSGSELNRKQSKFERKGLRRVFSMASPLATSLT
jgi:hypothetical protein